MQFASLVKFDGYGNFLKKANIQSTVLGSSPRASGVPCLVFILSFPVMRSILCPALSPFLTFSSPPFR